MANATNASRKTVFTFLYKLVLAGVTLVNSALAARYLGKSDRLEFQYAGTVANTGTTYVGGYSGYYSFALPKRQENQEAIVQMGNLFTLTLSVLVWVVALLSGWLLLPHLPHWRWVDLAWWSMVCMPFGFILGYGTRLLQGINHITWLNRANALQPLLFLLLYVPLFLDRNHLHSQQRLLWTYGIWIMSFGTAALITIIVAYRMLGGQSVWRLRFWRDEWRGTVKYGGWLSLSNLVNIANYRMDFWLVGVLLPTRIASDYGIAVTSSEVLTLISGSIASVVFTRMTGNDRSDAIHITELSTRHTLISSILVGAGMYVFFPGLILTVYTHKYAGAILPFMILLPGLIAKAASNMVIQYATNQLGSPRTAIWMNGISAVINAIACVLFIPQYGLGFGLAGAALASTTSYVLSFVLYIYWFGRVNRVNPRGLYLIRKTDLLPYIHAVTTTIRRLRRRSV